MPTVDSIRVALIEDESAIRKGLSLILDGTAGFRCVGTFGSVEEALRSLGGAVPDVLLLGMLAEGYTYQGAADRLGVSINTIRDHIKNIYDKLHVHSKTEAVRKALKNRLIF